MTAITRRSASKSPLLGKKQFLLLTRGTLFPLLMLFGAIVIIGLPLLMAVLWSLVDPDFPWSYPDVFPTRLSLYHWNFVFRFTGITKAIITSYTIAPLATIMAFILSLPPAYAIANYNFPGKEIIRIIILLPIILPGMVVALFLSRVFLFLDLSQTLFGLVLGHTLLGMPYMLRLLSTSFEAIPKEIGDAASNLGATNFYRLKDVFIPMLLPGIFAGSIFTFITSLEEFNLTFVIGTPSYQTIPTVLFAFLGYHFVRTNAAVVSLILMVPNVILLFIADRFLKTDFLTAAYGKL
jgi:putative spermidine/putrescine transport system permease protein